jgi:hypothetical protein
MGNMGMIVAMNELMRDIAIDKIAELMQNRIVFWRRR